MEKLGFSEWCGIDNGTPIYYKTLIATSGMDVRVLVHIDEKEVSSLSVVGIVPYPIFKNYSWKFVKLTKVPEENLYILDIHSCERYGRVTNPQYALWKKENIPFAKYFKPTLFFTTLYQNPSIFFDVEQFVTILSSGFLARSYVPYLKTLYYKWTFEKRALRDEHYWILTCDLENSLLPKIWEYVLNHIHWEERCMDGYLTLFKKCTHSESAMKNHFRRYKDM